MSSSPTIVKMSCRKPRWVTTENTITKSTTKVLGDNALIYIKNALSDDVVRAYAKDAVAVKRVQGDAVFGHKKPRYEIFYTKSGEPYRYSKISHATTTYPKHVLDVIREIEDVVASQGEDVLPNFGELDITGDILYDGTLKCGGRVAAHSDDERAWPIVIIFSLGQTRYLRLKKIGGDEEINVEMEHNSVVVMAGDTFQATYTHRVDLLSPSESVGARLSLNIRYLPEQTKRRRVK